MKLSAIDSIAMQEIRYVKEHSSNNAQVQRLLKQVDRETEMARSGGAFIHNPESFPNHIHYNSSDRIRRLLDII